MKKWFKISFLLLATFSVVLMGLSYASQVWYGDLRDYYPYGLEVKAERLTATPSTYTVLSNDTYIEQAITNGNWTWVNQSNSTFVNEGLPENILWTKNGNYYHILQRFSDGIPESWKLLPKPTTTAGLLAIPWTIFVASILWKKKHF